MSDTDSKRMDVNFVKKSNRRDNFKNEANIQIRTEIKIKKIFYKFISILVRNLSSRLKLLEIFPTVFLRVFIMVQTNKAEHSILEDRFECSITLL